MPKEGIRVEFDSFRNFLDTYSERISADGLFIASDQPFEVGTPLELEFSLKDGFQLLRGAGEVAWTGARSADGELGMAIRFSELDDPSRQLIAKINEQVIERGGSVFDVAHQPETGYAATVAHDGASLEGDESWQSFEAEDTAFEPMEVVDLREPEAEPAPEAEAELTSAPEVPAPEVDELVAAVPVAPPAELGAMDSEVVESEPDELESFDLDAVEVESIGGATLDADAPLERADSATDLAASLAGAAVDEPAIQESLLDEPALDLSAFDEPSIDDSMSEEPTLDAPALEEPTVEDSLLAAPAPPVAEELGGFDLDPSASAFEVDDDALESGAGIDLAEPLSGDAIDDIAASPELDSTFDEGAGPILTEPDELAAEGAVEALFGVDDDLAADDELTADSAGTGIETDIETGIETGTETVEIKLGSDLAAAIDAEPLLGAASEDLSVEPEEDLALAGTGGFGEVADDSAIETSGDLSDMSNETWGADVFADEERQETESELPPVELPSVELPEVAAAAGVPPVEMPDVEPAVFDPGPETGRAFGPKRRSLVPLLLLLAVAVLGLLFGPKLLSRLTGDAGEEVAAVEPATSADVRTPIGDDAGTGVDEETDGGEGLAADAAEGAADAAAVEVSDPAGDVVDSATETAPEATSAPADAAPAPPQEVASAAETVAPTPPAPASPDVGGSGLRVENVTWRETDRGTVVTVWTDTPLDVGDFETFEVSGGAPRVVVKLNGVGWRYGQKELVVATAQIARLRFGYHESPPPAAIHIVADLKESGIEVVDAQVNGKSLEVLFGRP